MRTGKLYLFALLMIAFVNFFSCSKEKSGSGSKTSAYNSTDSHNVGANCMSCHNSGGSNQYWWNIAGTVFKPDSTSLSSNSTIYLFTGVNGSGNLILTLPVDAKGNFYTTNSVNFSAGLYPAVKSASGETRYMQSSTTNGNCNSCHTSGHRIIVN